MLHYPVSGSSAKCLTSYVLEGAHVSLHPPNCHVMDRAGWVGNDRWPNQGEGGFLYLHNQNSCCIIRTICRYMHHILWSQKDIHMGAECKHWNVCKMLTRKVITYSFKPGSPQSYIDGLYVNIIKCTALAAVRILHEVMVSLLGSSCVPLAANWRVR